MSLIKIDPAKAAPKQEDYKAAIQSLIDETAASKGFDDGVTLASYVNSTVALWGHQASAFVTWRDDIWQVAFSEMGKMEGGSRSKPALSDFLLELPEIIWP